MMLVPTWRCERQGVAGIDSISIPVLRCERYQRPTNQTVEKFNVRDAIWLLEKKFFFCDAHDACDASGASVIIVNLA